ncbi:hypothetical protein GC207_07190 [bacterium]|nr:hypothetical protein [bacterium]
MKTTQVVSGFLLGGSLLIPSLSSFAQTVLDDGGVHVINDSTYRNDWIELHKGTTLRLEPGAEIGGDYDQSGAILVYDTSTLVLAGGHVGSVGQSSGGIYLYDSGQFIMESGLLGGDGYGSGQVIGFQTSAAQILGGTLGAAGGQSGMIGFFDTSHAELRGGVFVDNGVYSGLAVSFGDALVEVFLCQSSLPFGELADSAATIVGTWKDGSAAQLSVMREPSAHIVLVEDCADVIVDTDGDGVPDDVDTCPESDLRPTVFIREIDTGIPNLIDGQPVNADGCSLADLVAAVIDDAAANARNHGEFIRAVARGLQVLRTQGLLPSRWLGHFQECASRSNRDEARMSRYHRHRVTRDGHRGH